MTERDKIAALLYRRDGWVVPWDSRKPWAAHSRRRYVENADAVMALLQKEATATK